MNFQYSVGVMAFLHDLHLRTCKKAISKSSVVNAAPDCGFPRKEFTASSTRSQPDDIGNPLGRPAFPDNPRPALRAKEKAFFIPENIWSISHPAVLLSELVTAIVVEHSVRAGDIRHRDHHLAELRPHHSTGPVQDKPRGIDLGTASRLDRDPERSVLALSSIQPQ